MTLLVASFALCGIAFLILGAVALTGWRTRVRGSRLALACFVQAAWSALLVVAGLSTPVPLSLLIALEILRGLCWALVLAHALSPLLRQSVPRGVVPLVYMASAALPIAVFLLPLWVRGEPLAVALLDAQRWSGLLMAIAGLVLVEQFARNARDNARWQLRYLWLGIGILFAHDLALWSMVLLLGDVDGLLWASRGTVNTLIAVLLAVGIRRVPALTPRLFKSAGALFFNTTLVVAGGYVLLMALASYLLRSNGDASRPVVEAVFVGASLVVLAVALFSDQFRAWARVMLAKYLLPYRYDYRDVWLSLTRSLSESSDVPVHERVATSLASFVNSGSGRLWLRDEEGQYRRAGGGEGTEAAAAVVATAFAGRGVAVAAAPEVVTTPHSEFFEFLRARDWIFDLAEWRSARAESDRSSQTDVEPPAWLAEDPRAWLVVPLLCNDALVGFIVVTRPLAPTPLGWEQLDLLRAAGRQIGSYLAFERAATRLAEMHQFEALNRLSGFVMHDLRHLVAQLALVVDNAARHRNKPEFIDDAILTIDSSVQRMTGLMEVLKAGVVREPERRVDLADLAREAGSRCREWQPVPQLDCEAGMAEVMANRERLLQAVEHLVRNAQDATAASGSVTIRVRRGSHSARLDIVDTGSGMDAEFVRTRLFKPFDSTKGQQGMGLGAYEARDIVRKLGGSLTVDSAVGRGTSISIELPLAPTVSTVESIHTDG